MIDAAPQAARQHKASHPDAPVTAADGSPNVTVPPVMDRITKIATRAASPAGSAISSATRAPVDGLTVSLSLLVVWVTTTR